VISHNPGYYILIIYIINIMASSFEIGLVAVIAAPSLMVWGVTIWDNHWIGGSTFALNMFKCNLASIGFVLMSLVTTLTILPISTKDQHQPEPLDIFTIEKVGFLMLSSTIGILIGDWTWLEGMRILGARKVIVMDCLKPFLAAMVGKLYLGEELAFPAYIGLVLTIGGASIVGLEKERTTITQEEQNTKPYQNILDSDIIATSTTIMPTEEDALLPNSEEIRCPRLESYTEHRSVTVDIPSEQTRTYGLMYSILDILTYIGLVLTIGGESTVRLAKKRTLMKQEEETEPYQNTCNNSIITATNTPSEDDASVPNSKENQCTRLESYAEHRRADVPSDHSLAYGLMNSILNVLLHTAGATLTKMYGVGMNTWQINMIRFGFAGICMTLLSFGLDIYHRIFVATHLPKESITVVATDTATNSSPWYLLPSMMSHSSWMHVSLGVFLVSFLFPALVNFAMFQIPLALLLTLESIGPLYSLPISWMHNEHPTYNACFGAMLAVGGILILSFKGMELE